MRFNLFTVFFFFAARLSAQHFHSCTIYSQNRSEYSDDTLKHLCKVQYFNDYGKLLREEDYRFISHGSFEFDSVWRLYKEHFYYNDTLPIKSVFIHYRGATKAVFDTAIQKFHYNNLGRLVNDSTFYCGEITLQNYDLIYSIIACDTLVNQMSYDGSGHKIAQLTTDFLHGRTKNLGYKKRQTFVYDSANMLVKMSASYIYNNSNKDPKLPDIGDYMYKYSNGNLVEQTQYRYVGKDTTICKEIHTYTVNIIDNQIVLEYVDFVSSDVTRTRKIIEYGYFPDKRITKETKDGVTTSYLYK